MRKARYEQEKTAESADRYFTAMARLHDDAWGRQDLERSKQACEGVLALTEERRTAGDTENLSACEASVCYYLAANVRQRRKRL